MKKDPKPKRPAPPVKPRELKRELDDVTGGIKVPSINPPTGGG